MTTMLVLLSRTDTPKFVDYDINNNDESNGSSGKLRSSKNPEEKDGGIGIGWAKEKSGWMTTATTAMASRNNNGRVDKKSIGRGGAMKLGELFGKMKKKKGS